MPSLAMLLASLLWASSIVGSKAAIDIFSIGEIVVGRFIFAALVLWLIILVSRTVATPRQVGIRPIIMGLLDPGLVSVLMVWGLAHTAALNGAVFWALMPLIMPALGRVVLGERVKAIVIVSALIAVSASIWLVTLNAASGEGSLYGDFLLLCGIACAAVNGLVARRVAQSGANPAATTTYQMSSAILLGLAVLLFMSSSDGAGSAAPFSGLTFSSTALLFFLGVAATAGPFFLLNYAMKYLPIARTSLFSCLIGPFAMPLAAFFLGEQITPLEITAVAIVLIAVLLPSLAERWKPALSASSGD